MHPLIAAFVGYKNAVDLNIRSWSPYYSQWVALCDERREWLYQMKLEFRVVE